MSNEQPMGKQKSGWIIWGLSGAIVGAGIGFLMSPLSQTIWTWLDDLKASLLLISLGAFVGAVVALIYHRRQGAGKRVIIESVPIKVPVLGEVILKFDERQQNAGWHIFIELASRIATQELHPRTGLIREALTSHYQLFGLIRSELKSMPPSTRGLTEGQADIETYALTILNYAIRPCLARWHPRLKHWEASGMPEGEWPLAALCRSDLETIRQLVLSYTWGLGEALRVSRLNSLLPPKPNADLAVELVTDDILDKAEVKLIPTLADAQAEAGWRIYVEVSTRIATQPLEPGTGLLREAMTSLRTLFDQVRRELKRAGGPTPPANSEVSTVEELALRILNQDIRPFLAKWHPILHAWELANPGKPDTDWAQGEACRAALEELRQRVTRDCAELGRLIGVNLPDE